MRTNSRGFSCLPLDYKKCFPVILPPKISLIQCIYFLAPTMFKNTSTDLKPHYFGLKRRLYYVSMAAKKTFGI